MRTGTPSWRTQTPTCRSRAAGSLSRRQCITLCDSMVETECTPDIYQVILLRTAASVCQSNMPLRFLMLCRSGLPSLCSAGRQSTVTTQAKCNRVSNAVHVSAHLWGRAFLLHLRRERGGVKVTQTIVSARRDQVWQTGLSASRLLSDWWWRWRSWARSKAGLDQPGY
jgi:hypothetical protein